MVNPRRNDIKCHSGVGGNKPEIMEQNKQNNISLSSSQATAAAVSSSGTVLTNVVPYSLENTHPVCNRALASKLGRGL